MSNPVSIVIAVRVDTPDRYRNLARVLCFLFEYMDGAELILLEHGDSSDCRNLAMQYGAAYHFFETGGSFHKSRLLNFGIGIARREIVVIHDADVLVHSRALHASIDRVNGGLADFVLPYNGAMLQVKEERLGDELVPGDDFLEAAPHRELEEPLPGDEGFEYLYGTRAIPSAGGIIVGLRRSFVLYGGYNENIISYGCEDVELVSRLQVLGADVEWLPGYNCYHMQHRRGADSLYNNFHDSNLKEWEKTRNMSRPDLWRYVRNGFREIVLDSSRPLKLENSPDRYAISMDVNLLPDCSDVDFVLSLDNSGDCIREVDAFRLQLDSLFANYRLVVVERHGARWSDRLHRTHTLQIRWDGNGRRGWLEAVLRQADRDILVFYPSDRIPEARALREAVETTRRDGVHAGDVPAFRRNCLEHAKGLEDAEGARALKAAAAAIRRDDPSG